MKIRTLLPLILVATVAGGMGWWMLQSQAPAPAMAVSTRKAELPNPAAAKPVEAKPAEGPKAATSTSKSDPQTELGTALDDIVGLLQAGNISAVVGKYTPPEELAKMPQNKKTALENTTHLLARSGSTRLADLGPIQVETLLKNLVASHALTTEEAQTMVQAINIIQGMVMEYRPLKDQQPAMNATGDEATFKVILPIAMTNPALGDIQPRDVIFVKIDGKWYLKSRI